MTAFSFDLLFAAFGDLHTILTVVDVTDLAQTETKKFEVAMLYATEPLAGFFSCLGVVLAPVFLDKPSPYSLDTVGKKLLFILLGYVVGLLGIWLLPDTADWYSVIIVAVGWPKMIYGLIHASVVLGKAIELAKVQNQSPSHG